MADQSGDDAELLEPDPESPSPPRARRSKRPVDDEDRPRSRRHRHEEDEDDDEDDDRPRRRAMKFDADGEEITPDHTTWAMMAHLGVLIGWMVLGVLAFLPPMIIWINYSRKSAFVVRHARESLNHFLSLLLWYFLALGVAAGVGFAVYGLFDSTPGGFISGYVVALVAYAALGISSLVFNILASVAAAKGNEYRYPLTIRFIG
ncbi:MAG: DUF4870 domain-containing protein [Fimbriiglobus sp.]|jgi:hypothetical protein|nr:DUF4870 domain-containing protein [Fimbriiglobus sp.]